LKETEYKDLNSGLISVVGHSRCSRALV